MVPGDGWAGAEVAVRGHVSTPRAARNRGLSRVQRAVVVAGLAAREGRREPQRNRLECNLEHRCSPSEAVMNQTSLHGHWMLPAVDAPGCPCSRADFSVKTRRGPRVLPLEWKTGASSFAGHAGPPIHCNTGLHFSHPAHCQAASLPDTVRPTTEQPSQPASHFFCFDRCSSSYPAVDKAC